MRFSRLSGRLIDACLTEIFADCDVTMVMSYVSVADVHTALFAIPSSRRRLPRALLTALVKLPSVQPRLDSSTVSAFLVSSIGYIC